LKLENARSAVQVLKTIHTPHGGKMSVARVLTGEVGDGSILKGEDAEERVAGVFSLIGETVRKRGTATAGDTVAFGRLEKIGTAETLTAEKGSIRQAAPLIKPQPVYGQAIELRDRKDEVKMSAALTKLIEEDPSLSVEHAKDTHQIVLWGQGEMHLRVALERLKRKYGVDADTRRRQVPYKETIRAATEIRGRHKKQSGGHGQFGDVVIAIEPLQRGAGFKFGDKIHGGTVPKQFIGSVEIGVSDYLSRGPLGFPVVDVGVTLLDGSYHAVDSSDMAFRQAGRLAMSEGMPKCQPVLLEPVMEVEITVPSDATARVNAIIAQRRGQILGFDVRSGWAGWDTVQAHLPESEMADLIVELRSATAGVGTFTAKFHHLSELTGRLAEQVIAGREVGAG
jgi:elongation factor G